MPGWLLALNEAAGTARAAGQDAIGPDTRDKHEDWYRKAAETGIALNTDDADATHAQLKAAGVDVDEDVMRMGDPVPPMFWFRDPTGHVLMVVEQR